jgi:hypothetical protein
MGRRVGMRLRDSSLRFVVLVFVVTRPIRPIRNSVFVVLVRLRDFTVRSIVPFKPGLFESEIGARRPETAKIWNFVCFKSKFERTFVMS